MANGMLTISLQAHWQMAGFGRRGMVPRACTRLCVKAFQREDREVQCFVGCDVEPFKCNQKIGVFLQVRDREWKDEGVTLVALSISCSFRCRWRCKWEVSVPPLPSPLSPPPTPTVKALTPEVSVAVLACGYQRPVLWGLCNNKLLIERRSQRRPVSGEPSCWKITAARRLA